MVDSGKMEGIEKIRKGLAKCIHFPEDVCNDDCPYCGTGVGNCDCQPKLMSDALGLINELCNPVTKMFLSLSEIEKQTAVMYAVNYLKTGVDVTGKWLTATQHSTAMYEAEKVGYVRAMEMARVFESDHGKLIEKIIDIIAEYLSERYEPPVPVDVWYASEESLQKALRKNWKNFLKDLAEKAVKTDG